MLQKKKYLSRSLSMMRASLSEQSLYWTSSVSASSPLCLRVPSHRSGWSASDTLALRPRAATAASKPKASSSASALEPPALDPHRGPARQKCRPELLFLLIPATTSLRKEKYQKLPHVFLLCYKINYYILRKNNIVCSNGF